MIRVICFTGLCGPCWMRGFCRSQRGVLQAPAEYVVTESADLEEEREALLAAIERFLAKCEESPDFRARHPFFGVLTRAQWQRNQGMHLNYHLEQFGV